MQSWWRKTSLFFSKSSIRLSREAPLSDKHTLYLSLSLFLYAQKFFITYSLLLLQKEFLASDIILHLV